MTTRAPTITWLLLTIAASACSASAPSASAPGTTHEEPLHCAAASPTTLEEARRVVASRCASCHSPSGSAGPDYDWTNERALVVHRCNVAAQLAEDAMPPPGYPRPTLAERRALLCWARER
jgi:hypothetical protein